MRALTSRSAGGIKGLTTRFSLGAREHIEAKASHPPMGAATIYQPAAAFSISVHQKKKQQQLASARALGSSSLSAHQQQPAAQHHQSPRGAFRPKLFIITYGVA
mmetsp:Transcript_3728/g.9049  ORF Transcript_3728/g.9049 Transcript_3728/m.9049 type:complete len:104 (+) Transcript_3728:142-453(+)